MDTQTRESAAESAPGEAQGIDADASYLLAVKQYGPAMSRLARAYEADADRRYDLLQEIHIALWRSLRTFDARCSLRTWFYRIAHITATRHAIAHRRLRLQELHTLDDVPEPAAQEDLAATAEQDSSLQRLLALVQQLKPIDRQVILLYLEDLSAEEIGEVVGLSPENIATKIHRIKRLLTTMFHA
jgi:RNA polymerase sigma-70 factor (ECF subfamily)